jgi:hypothetical protein
MHQQIYHLGLLISLPVRINCFPMCVRAHAPEKALHLSIYTGTSFTLWTTEYQRINCRSFLLLVQIRREWNWMGHISFWYIPSLIYWTKHEYPTTNNYIEIITDVATVFALEEIFVFLSRHQNAGQNHDIKTIRKSFTTCRIWGFHSVGYEEYHLLGYDSV